MSEIRISLALLLLALHGGWEAGMMNNHTPIMDTLTPTLFRQESEGSLIALPKTNMKVMLRKSMTLTGTWLGPGLL